MQTLKDELKQRKKDIEALQAVKKVLIALFEVSYCTCRSIAKKYLKRARFFLKQLLKTRI